MIHLLILAIAALHLQDPAGDAVGDGTLTPPTAPIYANTAAFDLQSVTLTGAPDLTVRVTMGALPDAGKLPNGFSSPIVEVYLDTAPGGEQNLLPGSGMAMAPKHGWEIALRATGDTAYAVEAQSQGSPSSWPRLPVRVEVAGSTITLHTSIPRPKRADIYAITGVYDPFTKDGWRPISQQPTPWAFSSPTQHPAVVDLLASGQRAQRREIDAGLLTPYRSPTHGIGWLLLMLLGVLLAAFGAVARRRVKPRERGTDEAAADAPEGGVGVPQDGAVDGSAAYQRFLDEDEEAALWPDAEASVDRAVAASVEGDAVAAGDSQEPGATARAGVPNADGAAVPSLSAAKESEASPHGSGAEAVDEAIVDAVDDAVDEVAASVGGGGASSPVGDGGERASDGAAGASATTERRTPPPEDPVEQPVNELVEEPLEEPLEDELGGRKA